MVCLSCFVSDFTGIRAAMDGIYGFNVKNGRFLADRSEDDAEIVAGIYDFSIKSPFECHGHISLAHHT